MCAELVDETCGRDQQGHTPHRPDRDLRVADVDLDAVVLAKLLAHLDLWVVDCRLGEAQVGGSFGVDADGVWLVELLERRKW